VWYVKMKSITTVQRNSYGVHRCGKPDKIFKAQSDKFLVTRRSNKFATQSMRPKQIHSQSVQETIGTISNGVWLVLVSGSLSTFPDSSIGHSRPFSWSLYSCLSPLWIFSYGVHSGLSVCQLSNIMSPQLSWQETEPKIDIICAT
jgi:hypothetical protein